MNRKRKALRYDVSRENEDQAIRHLIPEVTENVKRNDPHIRRRAKQIYKNKRTRRSFIPMSQQEIDNGKN